MVTADEPPVVTSESASWGEPQAVRVIARMNRFFMVD
jgi:hypothetical protein